MEPTKVLLQAIAVTAELTGTELSKAAARVFAEDLATYPEAQVMGALVRCRKELRGRMTLADVISRLDDGRPGPEEAWATVQRSQSEAATLVWTEEMRQAWAVALPLIQSEEMIPARMAFLERYRALAQEARDAGLPVAWSVSPGTDPHERETVLIEAAEKGLLTAEHVARLLPYRDGPHPKIAALLNLKKAA